MDDDTFDIYCKLYKQLHADIDSALEPLSKEAQEQIIWRLTDEFRFWSNVK